MHSKLRPLRGGVGGTILILFYWSTELFGSVKMSGLQLVMRGETGNDDPLNCYRSIVTLSSSTPMTVSGKLLKRSLAFGISYVRSINTGIFWRTV